MRIFEKMNKNGLLFKVTYFIYLFTLIIFKKDKNDYEEKK